MRKERVYVIAGGEVTEEEILAMDPRYPLIGVDGGAKRCFEAGIFPQVVVGDFDTIGVEWIETFRNLGLLFIHCPL